MIHFVAFDDLDIVDESKLFVWKYFVGRSLYVFRVCQKQDFERYVFLRAGYESKTFDFHILCHVALFECLFTRYSVIAIVDDYIWLCRKLLMC